MPTNVVMPQMGESIAEGTIVRWIKKVGDSVDRDEPLFEISTDKVDAEIPSPAAGVLTEVRAKEGDTVHVNTVVAVIAEPGATAVSAPEERPPESSNVVPHAVRPREAPSPPPLAEGSRAPVEDTIRQRRSSPLVRRLARERGINIDEISGSGLGGRVTKQDILDFVSAGGGEAGRPATAQAPRPAPATGEGVVFGPGERTAITPMSLIRRKIAEHMIASRRTSAHVHSVFDVDFSRVAKLREAKKGEYLRSGAHLTYLAFIAKAAVDALRAMPIVNATIDGQNIVYRKDVNLGIAVALDSGLIVPVIKNADEKNLLSLSRAIADLAQRARSKQLNPEEVQGGTFTITNPGSLGTLFGMPIINQPQVAILGVGVVEKRPVVVDDAIAIRPRAYLTLGYDHRLIDGAVADQFMSHVKNQIENFDEATV